MNRRTRNDTDRQFASAPKPKIFIAPYRLHAETEITASQTVNAKPYAFGKNYVIFSTVETETYIIENPPPVADSSNREVEIWRSDDFSQGVLSRTLTLARQHGKADRALRILGVRQPHCPAARWQVDQQALESWRSDFMTFLQQWGFRRRGNIDQTKKPHAQGVSTLGASKDGIPGEGAPPNQGYGGKGC